MAEWIDTTVSLLRDKSIHVSYRIALVILVLISLFIINDLTGLYRNYTINRKLEQIKELQSIDSSMLRDPLIKEKLNELKLRVLQDQSYTGRLWSGLNHKEKKTLPTGNTGLSQQPIQVDLSKQFWYNLSTMLFAYLAMAILIIFGIPYNILFSKDTYKVRFTTMVGMIMLLPLCYLYGLFYKYIVSFVPIFNSRLWINYTINVVGQILFCYILFRIERHIKRAKYVASAA